MSFDRELHGFQTHVVRVLSVLHSEDVPAGLLGTTANSLGYVHEQCSFALNAPPSEPLAAYDAVVALGGTSDVEQRVEKAWIENELEMLSRLLESNIPFLGVCLGAQLMATAAGAKVTRMDEPEIGWPQIELTAEGRHDRLLGRLPGRFRAFSWHSWEFELPPAAEPLSQSDRCLQAFRIGACVWAVQFHPELTASTLERWIATYGDAAGIDPGSARRDADRNMPMSMETGAALLGRFLELAAGRADARL